MHYFPDSTLIRTAHMFIYNQKEEKEVYSNGTERNHKREQTYG
jgi:hypothetical protein